MHPMYGLGVHQGKEDHWEGESRGRIESFSFPNGYLELALGSIMFTTS